LSRSSLLSLPGPTVTTMRHVIFYLHSLALCSLVSITVGLSNPVQDFLTTWKGPGYNNGPIQVLQPRGQAVLKKLDLQASTEPRLIATSKESIPNLLFATAPTVLRAGSGVFAQGYKIQLVARDDTRYAYAASANQQIEESGVYRPPLEPIILYEFEACPFCRKVREACSMLSLPITFRPTPKNGRRFRPEIKDKYGASASFPFMDDRNTLVTMFESQNILEYLFRVYGNGDPVPWTLRESPLVPLTAGLGVGLLRLGAGGTFEFCNTPKEPMVLWAYEGSPYCKVVREKLSAMEIEHVVIYTPRGSENRQKLWEKTGRFQVPYLEE
jgi:glutaredoxin